QKKEGVITDSPFVHDSRLPNLELISPVQIAVQPASTLPGIAVVPNPKVSLDLGRQIARIVPQQTPTDAHSRRNEVPQIPLSEDVGAAVEMTGIDGGRTSRSSAPGVAPLKVRAHQVRTRGFSGAGQETLGTPQKQIVT